MTRLHITNGWSATKMETHISPSLMIVQSRLLSPRYPGNGRWAIYNAADRRGFLAPGSDSVPEVFRLMSRISATGCGGMDELQLRQLTERGLIVPESEPQKSPASTTLYHQANYNFPFRDYSDPDWRESDLATMRQYATLSPPPPLYSPRDGVGQSLLEIPEHEVILSKLAALLRFSFGAIGTVGSAFMQCLRKTSPSGGARHPTEAVVILRETIGHINPGAYYYCPERHALIAHPDAQSPKITGGLSIVLRSRVERAMWRYRDLRAYRPVVIDVGHIAETTLQYAAATGFRACLRLPREEEWFSDWLYEPSFATIDLALEDGELGCRIDNNKERVKRIEPEAVMTNPLMFMCFKSGLLFCQVSWPERSYYELPVDAIRLLSYCTPSARGDRDYSVKYLLESFPEHEAVIKDCIRLGVLIDVNDGIKLYQAGRHWFHYDWYLSLLQLAAFRCEGKGDFSFEHRFDKALIDSLVLRKTARQFDDNTITRIVLKKLLEDSKISASISIKALVFDGHDSPVSLFDWNTTGNVLESHDGILSRDEVRKMTIGQQPAGSGAVAIWLWANYEPTSEVRCYESILIELGRNAQRLIIAANALGLGAFMTPAIDENETFKALRIPKTSIAYLLALGFPKTKSR